jgi:hypothetical protein
MRAWAAAASAGSHISLAAQCRLARVLLGSRRLVRLLLTSPEAVDAATASMHLSILAFLSQVLFVGLVVVRETGGFGEDSRGEGQQDELQLAGAVLASCRALAAMAQLLVVQDSQPAAHAGSDSSGDGEDSLSQCVGLIEEFTDILCHQLEPAGGKGQRANKGIGGVRTRENGMAHRQGPDCMCIMLSSHMHRGGDVGQACLFQQLPAACASYLIRAGGLPAQCPPTP